MGKGIRCFVVDDHPAILSAVCDTLATHGVEIAGRAGRADDSVVEEIARAAPTIALVDLRMPGFTGIELTRRLGRRSPATGCILYTGYGDRALLTEAIDAGARGFLLKEAPLVDLVRAVETVASGGTYVDPVLAGILATPAATAKLAVLTQRERDVLRLLSDGLTNEQIGKELFISPETVRTHVRKAMGKLDADTRTEAVAKALRQSLIA